MIGLSTLLFQLDISKILRDSEGISITFEEFYLMMSTNYLQCPYKLTGNKNFSECNISWRPAALLCVGYDMGDAYCPEKALGGCWMI